MVVEPLDALSVLPETILYRLFRAVNVCSKTVLLAFVPPPFILPSISPVVETIAFLFVVQVLTIVTHAVCVDIDTMALHVVVRPLAKILAAVFP